MTICDGCDGILYSVSVVKISSLLKHTEQKRKRRFLRSARAQFLQERTLIFRLERNTLNFYCSDRNCAFTLWKNDKFLASQGKKMDKAAAKKFLSKGKIHYKDLVSRKTGRQYEATVEMIDPGEGNVQFNLIFPQR